MTLITLSTAWLIGVAADRYFTPPLAVIGPLARIRMKDTDCGRGDEQRSHS